MKKILELVLVAAGVMSVVMSCKEDVQIIFGTTLNPKEQIRKSVSIADTVELKVLQTWDDGRDIRYSYYFEDAGKEIPFRVCLPSDWDGKSKLPLVMFLHGGWNDENSYLDQNSKQLVRLADQHGYILVSPLGGDAAYGNMMHLPGQFGRTKDVEDILSGLTEERIAAQKISEADVINVLEIVLKNYPVDRKNMFLCGHSMGSLSPCFQVHL